ncbi:MAG: hypothetical protein K8F91_09960 [Candidatus Obscuribacterales bacterium]|nr:hypothetical protein [Candidatus Obscuribacterales bacterium]
MGFILIFALLSLVTISDSNKAWSSDQTIELNSNNGAVSDSSSELSSEDEGRRQHGFVDATSVAIAIIWVVLVVIALSAKWINSLIRIAASKKRLEKGK